MIRTLILSLAALALASCGTTSAPPSGPVEPIQRAPDADAVVLPAEACAAVLAEPLPPEGISTAVLFRAIAGALGEEKGAAFWRWLTVEHPGWGQEGWSRLSALRPFCPSG